MPKKIKEYRSSVRRNTDTGNYISFSNPDANQARGYGRLSGDKMQPRPIAADGWPYDLYDNSEDGQEEFDDPILQKKFAAKMGTHMDTDSEYVSRQGDPFSFFDDATVGLAESFGYQHKSYWNFFSEKQKKIISKTKNKLDKLEKKINVLYIQGDFEKAEEIDAIYDDLSEKLESYISDVLEDADPAIDLEDPLSDSDNTPEPEEYLAKKYHEFTIGNNIHHTTKNEYIDHVRHYLMDINPTFIKNISDEEIFDAMKDSYDSYKKRLYRENNLRKYIRILIESRPSAGGGAVFRMRPGSSATDGAVTQWGTRIPGGTQFGWSSGYPFKQDKESYEPVFSLKDLMTKHEDEWDRTQGELEPEPDEEWKEEHGEEEYNKNFPLFWE